jgi:hypothetical protein
MPKLSKWTDTVTVGQLVQKLLEFPQDTGIAYTWESNFFPVRLDQIEVIQGDYRVEGPVVLLDAET